MCASDRWCFPSRRLVPARVLPPAQGVALATRALCPLRRGQVPGCPRGAWRAVPVWCLPERRCQLVRGVARGDKPALRRVVRGVVGADRPAGGGSPPDRRRVFIPGRQTTARSETANLGSGAGSEAARRRTHTTIMTAASRPVTCQLIWRGDREAQAGAHGRTPLRRVVCGGAGGRQHFFRGINPYNVAACGNVVEPRAPGCGARVLSRRIRGTRNRAQHLRSAHARGMVPATFSQGQLTPGGGGFAAERIGLDSVVTQAALCGCGRDHGCTGLWPWLNSQGHKVRTKFPSVGFSPRRGTVVRAVTVSQ